DAEWAGMCRALDRPAWLEDDRFKSAAGRVVNVAPRLAMTAEVLLTRSSEEWLQRLDREGVPCAPVLDRHEVIEHEQIRINELIEEFDHPVAGRMRQPRPAARFDVTPAAIRAPAPMLGEHTDAVLLEAGFGRQEIDALRAAKVVLG
ncbi:MAG: CoA transferase, partial [Gammaproteobacteria bacterium]|nr:CoA transferase [Gammaproteobacteria bacterium]